jgi:nicotinamidase-related amidase
MTIDNKKVAVFVIDPQNDFVLPTGALSVPGAQKDMDRLADFLDRVDKKVDQMFVTLDSHHVFDIGHPSFYINGKGEHPAPFTPISRDDIAKGTWRAALPAYQKWLEDYAKALETNGRYGIMVWSEHCLIGSPGAAVYEPLFKAFCQWEKRPGAFIRYQTKGSNFKTEHYSIFQADVPDPQDTSTQFNQPFAQAIGENDIVYIAGEARTHCVLYSLKDLVSWLGDDFCAKMIILEDTMSNISGFEQNADVFFADLVKKGAKIQKSTEVVL